MPATVLNHPCMNLRGKKADDTNSEMKKTGNEAWTASVEPVRRASVTPAPPMARASTAAMTTMAAALARPPSIRAPKATRMAMNTVAWTAPCTAVPARRPTRMNERDTGEDTSRSKKPSWMSRAMSLPPVVAPKSTPWMTVAASWKSRNECTFGNPGRRVARWNAAVLRAANSSGKNRDGNSASGWRSVPRIERRDRIRSCRSLTPPARSSSPRPPRRSRPPRRPPAGGRSRPRTRRRATAP